MGLEIEVLLGPSPHGALHHQLLVLDRHHAVHVPGLDLVVRPGMVRLGLDGLLHVLADVVHGALI